jgi:GNAT superfamily N-acetyltransferase
VTSELAARHASAADIDLVTSIISPAMAHDPLWEHAFARPDGRTVDHAAFWRVFVAGALRYPCSWVTVGEEATAVWIPPDGIEMTPEQEQHLAEVAADQLGPAADDYLELLSRFTAAHPLVKPHYYLTLLATHPLHWGKGIGMRLLAHNLELVDAEHLPAYLESSNPSNTRRYAAVGFEPRGEFRYPREGPMVTTMWRPAR